MAPGREAATAGRRAGMPSPGGSEAAARRRAAATGAPTVGGPARGDTVEPGLTGEGTADRGRGDPGAAKSEPDGERSALGAQGRDGARVEVPSGAGVGAEVGFEIEVRDGEGATEPDAAPVPRLAARRWAAASAPWATVLVRRSIWGRGAQPGPAGPGASAAEIPGPTAEADQPPPGGVRCPGRAAGGDAVPERGSGAGREGPPLGPGRARSGGPALSPPTAWRISGFCATGVATERSRRAAAAGPVSGPATVLRRPTADSRPRRGAFAADRAGRARAIRRSRAASPVEGNMPATTASAHSAGGATGMAATSDLGAPSPSWWRDDSERPAAEANVRVS